MSSIEQHRLLVTGSSGLLGTQLVPSLLNRKYPVFTQALTGDADFKADLSDEAECYRLLNEVQPKTIINLVGLTSVELCEAKPDLAYKVNTKTVENIVKWIRSSKTDCHLIHISTDQIYDGGTPKAEHNITITNTYAFSKYAAEIAAAKIDNTTILRTNFIGKSQVEKRESITDWVYSNILNNIPINVFDDVFFSPLSIGSLCDMIAIVIQKAIPGTFNLGSKEGMTKADLDFFFAEELKLPTGIMTRIHSDQATQLKAYRPKDMRMNCSKFEQAYGIELPDLKTEIKKVAREYITP